MKRHLQTNRSAGFTLLEVLLAITVLLVGLTAVFQTTLAALQRMTLAKELTVAQNACQSLLNELLARSAPIQEQENIPIEGLPDWQIRLDIYPASQPGLYVLHLSVLHGEMDEVKYQLRRWVPEERVLLLESSSMPSGSSISNEFDSLFQ